MFLLSTMLKAQTDSSFFKVSHSTSQGWAGGAVGSGSGTYYKFTIKFAKNANVTFDTVWVGKKPCYINDADPNGKKRHVNKGDSIVLNANAYYPSRHFVGMDYVNEVKENNSLPPLKCDAFIQFHVNGKKYFYPVKGIKVLPPIAYP